MLQQRTIGKSISASGVGLHSGKKVNMTLRPANENIGIVFRRVDLDPVQEIEAKAEFVTDTVLGTTITKNSASVMTVEHLLAAFSGLGIDNVYVDLKGPELPILVGCCISFILLIVSCTLLGVISTNYLEKHWGKDPSKVVMDEVIGMWITMAFIPFSYLNILKFIFLSSIET